MLTEEVKVDTLENVVDRYGTNRVYIFILDELIGVEDIEEICTEVYRNAQEAYEALMRLAKEGRITIRITRPAAPEIAREYRVTDKHPLKIWHSDYPVLYYARDEHDSSVIIKVWETDNSE